MGARRTPDGAAPGPASAAARSNPPADSGTWPGRRRAQTKSRRAAAPRSASRSRPGTARSSGLDRREQLPTSWPGAWKMTSHLLIARQPCAVSIRGASRAPARCCASGRRRPRARPTRRASASSATSARPPRHRGRPSAASSAVNQRPRSCLGPRAAAARPSAPSGGPSRQDSAVPVGVALAVRLDDGLVDLRLALGADGRRRQRPAATRRRRPPPSNAGAAGRSCSTTFALSRE